MNRTSRSAWGLAVAFTAAAFAALAHFHPADAGGGRDAARSPDDALRIARLTALYEMTRIHLAACENNSMAGELQQETIEGLRAEVDLGLTWTSHSYPATPGQAFTLERRLQPDHFEKQAMAKLRDPKTKSREMSSGDRTRYVQAIRLDKTCAKRHKGFGAGEPEEKRLPLMGFLSPRISVRD